MLAISAINEVLFERQGYQGRPNHGDVRQGTPAISMTYPLGIPLALYKSHA